MSVFELNGVFFKLDGDRLLTVDKPADPNKDRNALQKKRQELCSWSWFYMNSKDNLISSRYHKMNGRDRDGNMALLDIFIDDMWSQRYVKPIYYSQRIKDDRITASKINQEINSNQLELNKFYKK